MAKTELYEKRKEYLDCDLTKDEIIACGDLAAKARDNVARLEAEFDVVKKKHKDACTAQEQIIDTELSKVSRKKEAREVGVEMHADWGNGLMHYMRTDTGEIYRTRPVTDGEKQTAIWKEQDAERKAAAAEAAIEIHKEVFGVASAGEREDG